MSRETHLTHNQLCDILLAPPQETSPQMQHLRDCPLCAAELASMRQSLSDFQAATKTWASHTMANRAWSPSTFEIPVPLSSAPRRFFERQILWASTTLLFAAAVPLTLHYHRTSAQAPAAPTVATRPDNHQPDLTGDEALLEEIDQTLSSSIPTPMQPLADPTAGRSSQRNSTLKEN